MNNATIGKLNDISGFFAKYNELNQAHFQSLFGENLTASDIETLDYCLSDLYGARFLQSRFNDIFNNQSASDCMSRIVSISDRMFFENWLDTKRAIEKALTTDLEKPLVSSRNGENATENKVNAFDSETAVDSDESSHTYTETKTYSNGKTATQNAENQIDFSRNNDFLEIIVNDVLSVACTSVYDDNYVCEITQGGGTDPDLENRVEQCETDITNIKKLIPATATEQNKLATMADVQSGYDDTEIRGEISEINENINGIYDDLTDCATKAELQAVENSIPDTTGLATKAELQAVENSIPDVSGLATKQELQTVQNSIPDVTGLATKAELQTVQNSIPDVTGLATKQELQAVENSIPDVTGLATKQELQAVENSIPDVTGLATKTELQAVTDLIPSNASTTNKLATMADVGGGGSSDTPWIKKSFSVSGITNGRFSINVVLGAGTDGNGNYYLGYDSTEYTANDIPEVDVIMWGLSYPIIRRGNTTINGMGGMQLNFLLLDNTGSVSSVANASGMIIARKRTMAS